MASNLASIGFEFASSDQFQEQMLGLAVRAIERLGCAAGDYVIWRSRTGAEIWFHLTVFGTEDDARDIAGLTPFFEGASEVALEITGRLRRPDDNPFEGQLTAGLSNGSTITFDAVDFATHADRPLPFAGHARLTAFAYAMRGIGDGEPADAASTRLSGVISDVRHLENEATGGRFVAAQIDCGVATIDVVADASIVPTGLGPGARIEIGCRLFGRLITEQ